MSILQWFRVRFKKSHKSLHAHISQSPLQSYQPDLCAAVLQDIIAAIINKQIRRGQDDEKVLICADLNEYRPFLGFVIF